MSVSRAEFLERMIDILDRLHDTCVENGEPLLASVLAIAKSEAEDAWRHSGEVEALIALRNAMSSRPDRKADDPDGIAA